MFWLYIIYNAFLFVQNLQVELQFVFTHDEMKMKSMSGLQMFSDCGGSAVFESKICDKRRLPYFEEMLRWIKY